MLMMTHKTDIDHIIHDLEQIEYTRFDDRLEMDQLEHSKVLAKEVIDEFLTLIHSIESEEHLQKELSYNPQLMEDMCMIAYDICLYGHYHLFEEPNTLEMTIERCSQILGCEAQDLMSLKVMYDSYLNNIRMHREQTIKLSDDMRVVMEVCNSLSRDELFIECRKIIRVWH